MTDVLSLRVAAAVRAELARHQVKQRQVAELLGVSHQQVSERLAGRTAFRLDELERIANHLRVPVTTFISERTAA